MSALDRLKLLGDRADALTKWQAEAELRTKAEQRNEKRDHHRERAATGTCCHHGGGSE
jgi:hypothetical protein